MILRIVHTLVLPGKQAEYEKLMREVSIPHIKSQRNILAYFVGRPMGSSPDDFVFITLWQDFASVKAFAGENWEQPVLRDKEIRLVKEASVRHYQVLGDA
jgi:hypothetical protein